MNIILCGYHWTGCKALSLLLEEGHTVFVYTHETKNCVADLEGLCIKKNVRYTFEKITVDNLPFAPDIICSVYYQYIIDSKVIECVNGKIFNLHPSLLPQYRGCSSLTWAMIKGERKCGFTYHYIDRGCDTGNIILQKQLVIEDFDTQLTLYNRVMFESMEFFLDVLKKVKDDYPGIKQEGEGSFYKRGCPLSGIINDTMEAEMQERFVRAMVYPPYAPAKYKGDCVLTFKELQRRGGGVIIVGCGGHARSIIGIINRICSDTNVLLVDENARDNEYIMGIPVVKEYVMQAQDCFFIAIGNNKKRQKRFDEYVNAKRGKTFLLIADSANVDVTATIKNGTLIGENCFVGSESEIGENSIINTGAIIEHGVCIGNHTHIAPNVTICGKSVIGNNVFCGAGSTIIDGIAICDNVTIGAGSVVVHDIDESGTYVGIPARRLVEKQNLVC